MEYIFGKNTVESYIDSKSIIEVFALSNFSDDKLLRKLRQANIKISFKDKNFLDKLSNFNKHQGIIASIKGFEYATLNEIIQNAKKKQYPFIVALDGIEDPHNVGAIIRTCEAAGIKSIIIPKDRSVSVTSTVMKTSAGALEHVDIAMVNNLVNVIDDFKDNGYFVYAADMDGTNYKQVNYADKVLLVIGSEGNGIGRLVKKNCDEILSIPQFGHVNSLNASVAAAILIYGIVNK